MIEIKILSRPGCHLCDEAKRTIERVADGLDVVIVDVDISADVEIEARYAWDIPVVFVDGKECFRYRVDAGELRAALAATSSRR